jgi:chromosomal replication initiator protein
VTNNGKEIASALQKMLAERIGKDRFELWFDNDVTLEIRNSHLEVEATDEFQLDQIRRRFTADLEAVGLQITGSPVQLLMRVGSAAAPSAQSAPSARQPSTSGERCETRQDSDNGTTPPTHATSVDADASAAGADPTGAGPAGGLHRGMDSRSSSASTPAPFRIVSEDRDDSRNGRDKHGRHERHDRNGRNARNDGIGGNGDGESVRGNAAPMAWREEGIPFLIGDENRVAAMSADMVLEHPGRTNPLFIYGPTGAGKTHLLDSIRRKARRCTGLRRIVSVSAEQFTSQFVEALQGSGLPNFRRKYRQAELLLIDDLQFFLGKKSTIGELQNTVDYFLREKRQLVLAADRSPTELSGMSQELRGRISGGVVCQVNHPEPATRQRILRQLAARQGTELPEDVLELLANRFLGDVRQLSGALNRLHAWQQADPNPWTVERAEWALSDLLQTAQRVVRLADIEGAVCEVFGIDRERLHSPRKEKLISQPRMLAMWLARKHTRAGLSEICRYFGRRSHSTVVSAQRNVNRWVSTGSAIRLAHGDCPVEDAIRRVESKLRSG